MLELKLEGTSRYYVQNLKLLIIINTITKLLIRNMKCLGIECNVQNSANVTNKM